MSLPRIRCSEYSPVGKIADLFLARGREDACMSRIRRKDACRKPVTRFQLFMYLALRKEGIREIEADIRRDRIRGL